MMDFISPGIAGGLSFLGQSSANRANSREAQKTRDWQERMSGSNYQRMMKDMEAAGLNPILGLTSGGSPVGGSPTATSQSATEKGVSNALEARRLRADVANLEAMNKKINSDTSLNEALTRLNAQRILLDSATNASEIAYRAAQVDNLVQQGKQFGDIGQYHRDQSAYSRAQTESVKASSAKNKATKPFYEFAGGVGEAVLNPKIRRNDKIIGADLYNSAKAFLSKHYPTARNSAVSFYNKHKRDRWE